ncbi:MAG TPA: two-component system response regulator [Candidatus Marinimicrobia bacterium]|nr:two-component system response regulator [Candidatus Neomarinimicrobiota bacterium]
MQTNSLNLSVLLIDDDASHREVLCGFLEKLGCQVDSHESGEKGIAALKNRYVDIVITDFRMSGMNGLDVLKQVKDINSEIQVIILTAYGTIEDSVEAMKNGAWDYLSKPVDLNELELKLKKVAEHNTLKRENEILHLQQPVENIVSDIVYKSKRMEEVLNLVVRVSNSQSAILILGESGTGKEMIAKAIHQTSPRKDKPFVVANCAAIPEALFESELFGREKGAYTGAHEKFKGRFEIADGGTLFLDEVADIPYSTQVKLLRFIQEKEFQRLGSTQVIKSDVRILSATNVDIEQLVKENKFRSDLFFRLNVIPIEVPPLRKRREDIPLLVNHFIHKHSQLNKSRVKEISSEGLDLLMRYDYPGNVRELENIIERAVILSRGSIITREDLPLNTSVSIGESLSKSLPDQVGELEKSLIRKALQQSNGIQAKAAELLGITDRMLRYKLMKYNIWK